MGDKAGWLLGYTCGVTEPPSLDWEEPRASVTSVTGRKEDVLKRYTCPSFSYQTFETMNPQELEPPARNLMLAEGQAEVWCQPELGCQEEISHGQSSLQGKTAVETMTDGSVMSMATP